MGFQSIFSGHAIALVLLGGLAGSSAAVADVRPGDFRAVADVGPKGIGNAAAIAAAKRLRALPADQLDQVLNTMADATKVGKNWLRGIAFDIARRSQPDANSLTQYIDDQSNSADGRSVALELLERIDPEAARSIIDAAIDDPSLRIRRAAVAAAMERAAEMKPAQANTLFREILPSVRHPKQITRLVGNLKKAGDTVTLGSAMNMVSRWHVIGPFDNVGGSGFDRVETPERRFTSTGQVDLEATMPGKTAPVQWQVVVADEDGRINLAEFYDREKGATAYAYFEFESSSDQPAQIRLTSVTANKVWLNGKLVMVNPIYHSGTTIDQYVADCELKAGTNRILMKNCQNEQTQGWAQDWEFQMRLTDPTGKGLQP